MSMESAIEIERSFLGLMGQSDSGGLRAHPIVSNSIYLACDPEGNFLCLINNPSAQTSPPVRLKYLSVDYGLRYKAFVEGREISGLFTVITLSAKNSTLLFAFSTLLHMLTKDLGHRPTPDQLRQMVDLILELFTPKGGDPRERIKGLYGELAVIRQSQDVRSFVEGWHDNTLANKDFSLGNYFLEVKTTEGKVRQHKLSSRQLESNIAERRLLLASVLIEEDPRGETVFDVLEDVQKSVDAVLQQKMVMVVFETLGLDTDEAHELKFALNSGQNSILVFDGDSLPRPEVNTSEPMSAAISQISFNLNLDVVLGAGISGRLLSDIHF